MKELINILDIKEKQNVFENALFDYCRVVSINQKKYEEAALNPLYFLSYSSEEEIKSGWYTKPFDLRCHMNNIMEKYPHATFVIEKGMEKNINQKNTKYIVVDNILEAINKLYSYSLSKSSSKVIAVTGSVGKTTAAGIIESVVKEKYKTLRIYSKRITPIILKAFIINCLTEDIDFVILEYSIYYHNHVKILCELLPPDISCILNISSSHLGVEKLNSLDDICIFKSEILKYAEYGLLNYRDSYLNNLHLENGEIYYQDELLFQTNLKHLSRLDPEETKVVNDLLLINNEITVKPFILSSLSKIQYIFAYKIGNYLNLNSKQIENGLNNYIPVENRLKKEKAFGHDIIFDGDITTYERTKELSDVQYHNVYFVIRKVGSNENTFRIDQIGEYFYKFTKVYIFEDIEYLNELKQYPNVVIVKNHDFLKELDGTVIYHYSGYYRVWNHFLENNLEIYDKEVYPIKR